MTIPTRQFGHNGPELSILGFGAMRLPGFRQGRYEECMDEAVNLLRRGIELGINYIDTAQLYDMGYSEIAVGKAIHNCRDQVYIATKILPPMISSADDFKRLFEESCKRLDTHRIDVFHFHGLLYKQFEGQLAQMRLLAEAEKLKASGRIGTLGFSCHDTTDNIHRLIDTDAFGGMLVQYNFIDETNTDVIAHAHDKGMGVAVMGPVGGGRLAGVGPDFTKLIPPEFDNSPALALKFVWSNPGVTVALSGMESKSILETNIQLAKDFTPMTKQDYAKLDELRQNLAGLKEIYCSGCGYCLPCEQDIHIPGIFNLLICHEIFGAKRYAKDIYRMIGFTPIVPGRNVSACIECGKCEEKCPQKIPIIEQLKRTHELLSTG
ncbi:MAG: aldo/keto reductase [Chloroflexota bacterium]|nr:aldo/keto reductase [Chloroflexota bacterium]